METIRSTFIDKTVLIHVQDGRAFKGTFVCTDDSSNVILANSEEFKLIDNNKSSSDNSLFSFNQDPSNQNQQGEELQQRWVGMVMVRGQDIEKIEIQAGNWNPIFPPSPSVSQNTPLAPPGWPSDPSLYM